MKDYFIKNTSGELQCIINTDLERLKKVNEMYEFLEWLTENTNNDNMVLSSTEMNKDFTENNIMAKMIKIKSLLNESES